MPELRFVAVTTGEVLARADLDQPGSGSFLAGFLLPGEGEWNIRKEHAPTRSAKMSKETEQMTRHTLASGDAAISQAIADGRLTEDRRAHYQMQFSANPDGTLALLAQLQSVDPAALVATTAPSPTAGEEAYPQGWLNDTERSVVHAALEGKAPPKVVVEQ